MSSSTVTVVSAPGKVLIIGGYLILDRLYQGLTIGTDARFYTVIKTGNGRSKITVHSPQFNDATWEYQINDSGQVEAIRNSFVEITVKYSLSVIATRILGQKFNEIVNQGLEIYIVGSNDFYSQRGQDNVDGEIVNRIVDPASGSWDNEVVSTALPPRFTLIVADVDVGSNTPSLVGKVIAWRKANPEQAKVLWDTLASHNYTVIDSLRELVKEYEDNKLGYEKAMEICSDVKGTEKIRQLLRDMSTFSGAPIEPPEQTRLLDACAKVPGVIMAGVPGAGGYDAIFCIGIGTKFVEKVEDLWFNWEEMKVGPLLANESSEGLKVENLNDVKGLINVTS
ncbi:10957_t:CDS:2 [Acaulospora colombiana]|uniref:10957_t:CDS:1 n=1 Tax=Acaulospora colombiana TaxID=27376 RepID=A0ACA9KX65_9GLOM|nr:10957_t:CDS:2 [Acaulospora colombiana]